MTLVLDAGGLPALAAHRARLRELLDRGLWPAHVPAIVLTEELSGDHRRDFHTNRVLRTCVIGDVDEARSREAARLQAATGRAGTISAVDAVVAAHASAWTDSVIITSDPADLRALVEHTPVRIRVVQA